MNKKWEILVGVLATIMAVLSPAINAATQQAITPDTTTEPVEAITDIEKGDDNYIQVGHVEAIYGNFGDGDITVNAYEKSITLTDDDNDGTLKTTVGVDYAVWQPKEKTKHVFILFGIWKNGNNRAFGSGLATATESGWTYGYFTTTFSCPNSEISLGGTEYKIHVRAICTFGYGHDTAPFTVNLGTKKIYQHNSGSPRSIDMRIEYSSGAVIANNVVSVTAGSNVGEYYLHTMDGHIYLINDTIPTYLLE